MKRKLFHAWLVFVTPQIELFAVGGGTPTERESIIHLLVFATNQLKALVTIEDVHLAQAINYLEAYNLQTGLLINFVARSLQFKRVFNKSWQS
jgi:GxxExxY protein